MVATRSFVVVLDLVALHGGLGFRQSRRPRRTHAHPILQDLDLLLGQLLLGRHGVVFIAITHGFDQQAAFDITGHQCGPRRTTCQKCLTAVRAETSLDTALVRVVALKAVLRQHGAHLAFKELELLGRRRVGDLRHRRGSLCRGLEVRLRQVAIAVLVEAAEHRRRTRVLRAADAPIQIDIKTLAQTTPHLQRVAFLRCGQADGQPGSAAPHQHNLRDPLHGVRS